MCQNHHNNKLISYITIVTTKLYNACNFNAYTPISTRGSHKNAKALKGFYTNQYLRILCGCRLRGIRLGPLFHFVTDMST